MALLEKNNCNTKLIHEKYHTNLSKIEIPMILRNLHLTIQYIAKTLSVIGLPTVFRSINTKSKCKADVKLPLLAYHSPC